jgi:2-polyprenyl-3-methyl-5-hydroxy-6-metoxy-1,4-benzoquinol methylase
VLSIADPGPAGPPEPWSHNLHYHRVILEAVPPGCERALDVGCGQGTLTRRLRRVVPQVTGIDRDQRSIDLARANPAAAGIAYVLGDFLAAPFRPGSLDLVTSVASLHHMDAGTALRRMSGLLRPGGVLAVIGLARARPAWCAVPAPPVLALLAGVDEAVLTRASRGRGFAPTERAWHPEFRRLQSY